MLNVLSMEALATVPVVCAALGPVAGYPAGRLAAAHFSLACSNSLSASGPDRKRPIATI